MRRIIIPLFMLILNQPSALGQWQASSNGIAGTFSKDMVTVGNELLIATGNQIFRSDMEGENWIPSSLGLPTSDTTFISLMVHQGRVFCGSTTTIYYSDDNGLSWTESINVGFRIMEFAEIGNTLFVATFGGGCLKSTDIGISWQPVVNGMPADSLYSILTVGSSLYLGTVFYGLLRSQDVGITWQTISTDIDSINVLEIVSNGTDLYVGLREWPSSTHYVKKSVDGGLNWIIMTSPVFPGSNDDHLLAKTGICVGSNTVLMACEQLVRTTDGGSTWNSFTQGYIGFNSYLSFHETEDYIFMCSSDWQGSPVVYKQPKQAVLGTSTEDFQVGHIEMHPNPAHDNVTIISKKGTITGYHIVDALGREVASEMFAAPSVRFEVGLSHLAAGMYTLHAHTPAGPVVVRVVKE